AGRGGAGADAGRQHAPAAGGRDAGPAAAGLGAVASRKRLLINAVLSLAVAAICIAYSLHDVDVRQAGDAIRSTSLAAVGLFVATLIPTHLFRAWRWEYLLRALGTSLPFGRLMLISSVGFMAILGLPFRLGEVVRPYYVAREGHSRISTML